MKNNTFYILLAIFFVTFVSCEDFGENNDLGNERVNLIAPSNDLVTQLTTLTFWWDSIETIEMYNIQIVSRSFAHLEEVILDSIIPETKLRKRLRTGEFEWRVRAIGETSVVYSDTFRFVITQPDEE